MHGKFITWAEAYNIPLSPDGIDADRIIGGEATMWGEVNNPNTIDDYLWVRASSIAERLWNSKIDQNEVELVTRLVGMKNLLNSRTIGAAPVTVELCELNPSICFDSNKKVNPQTDSPKLLFLQ